MLEQTNAFRKAQGLAPLATDPALDKAAQAYARHMAKAGTLGHTVDGRQPAERAQAQGYEACIVAENVGYQYDSRGYEAPGLARELMEGWKKSPGHRENLEDGAVSEIGVGIAQDEKGGYFGVQLFGRPRREAIRFSVQNGAGREIAYRAGDREFTLPPRATREHMICRPVTIAIEALKFSRPVRDGATYAVRGQGVSVRE